MNLNIQPINLLSGSHANTGKTGQGCFMNVIAYLNGEAQITDQSPCVCVTVRPIAIWLNDYMTDNERRMLLPYIERAMGSATSDQSELSRRAWLAVGMAETMRDIAAASAASAARAASTASAASAARAAWAAWAASAASADRAALAAGVNRAASAAEYEKTRQQIIAVVIKFLDSALPKAQEFSSEVAARADELARLNSAAALA